MAIKRCKQPFTAWANGVPTVYIADKLFDTDDPAYKGLSAEQQREFFEDAELYTQRRMVGQAETATAAPGERRTVARGKSK